MRVLLCLLLFLGGIHFAEIGHASTVPASDPLSQDRRTIDFTSLSGSGGARSIDLGDGVRITSKRKEGLFVYGGDRYGMPATGGVCALSSGFRCLGSMSLVFDSPVMGLMFRSFFVGKTDRAEILVFNGATLLGKVKVSKNRLLNLSGFGEITRVDFRDKSSGFHKGIAYGDFRYLVPVPLPGGIVLLASALGLAYGFSRRRITT